jgi:hypothetical protein
MGTKKSVILLILISFLCLLPPHQDAFSASSNEDNKRRHWFSALSLTNKWRIFEGTADVVISDGNIKAELYDADENGFHRVSITGTIKKDKINAIAIRHGTDDSLRKLTGVMTANKVDRSVRTGILLDENNACGFVIGLTLQTDR